MTELFADFRDLLAELQDARAEFMIVGGHAVAFHGHPRATKDLDVFVRASPENANRVVEALAAFGAPLMQVGVSASDFEREGTVVQLGIPPVRIDIITFMPVSAARSSRIVPARAGLGAEQRPQPLRRR